MRRTLVLGCIAQIRQRPVGQMGAFSSILLVEVSPTEEVCGIIGSMFELPATRATSSRKDGGCKQGVGASVIVHIDQCSSVILVAKPKTTGKASRQAEEYDGQKKATKTLYKRKDILRTRHLDCDQHGSGFGPGGNHAIFLMPCRNEIGLFKMSWGG